MKGNNVRSAAAGNGITAKTYGGLTVLVNNGSVVYAAGTLT